MVIFIYSLDTDHLQIGYSGVENRPEVTNLSDKYFAEANAAVCSTESIRVPIYPAGSKALCWNCDGGYSYIYVIKSDKIINRPSPEVLANNPYVVSAREYTTKSGLTGDFIKRIKDQTTYLKNPIQSQVTLLSFAFVIGENEYVVYGSGNDYNPQLANIEKDFIAFIDHIYLTNDDNPQVNDHTVTPLYNTYIAKENGDFEISYPVTWKVITKKLPNPSASYPGDSVSYNLTNGDYTINIVQSETGKAGYCAGVLEEDEEKVYSKVTIDSVDLAIPLVTKTKAQSGIGFGTSVYRIEIKPTGKIGYCTFAAGKNDYTINVYSYEQGIPVNAFDQASEKEIVEILKSIKWAKK